jgi:dipeptidase E
MPIILTSNGLSSAKVVKFFKNLADSGLKNAAIVVTADPVYRENNWIAVSIKEKFNEIGFSSSFFDIEINPSDQLLEFDIVFFIGGNPYYLLNQLRRSHTDDILRVMLLQRKVISGSSAGCIVMGQTIALINEFDPQMNAEVGLTDFSGLGLTTVNLCPHYSRYIDRYENFEERICRVERDEKITITRINDGEAIVIDGENVVKV